MAKAQRLIFVFEKTKSGKLNISMKFYPPLATSEEAFNAMPMYQREMQNAAADMGRFAMMQMARKDKGAEPEQVWIDEAATLTPEDFKKIVPRGTI